MAFTKTPAESTYKTFPIRFLPEHTQGHARSGKDEEFVNVIPELFIDTDGKKAMSLMKRPGMAVRLNMASTLLGSPIRGAYWWNNWLVVAASNDVYLVAYNGGTFVWEVASTLTNVLANSTGDVGFTEFLYDNGNIDLILSDGVKVYTLTTGGTLTASADADLPAHRPYPVFLDGYIFVAETGSGDIYNSNLNAPLLWTAGDFITAESVPDNGQQLVRLNNYLLAFGQQSIEYFYNAGIASGSPLQRFEAPIKFTGLRITPVASYGNKIFFIGAEQGADEDVFVLEDTKITSIGTPEVRRYIKDSNLYSNTSISVLTVLGHDLLFVYFSSPLGTFTYVYDIDLKIWVKWKFQAGASFPFITMTGDFIVTSNVLYTLDTGVYQDNSTNFSVVITTDNYTFDTYNQKTIHRLCLFTDKPTSSQSVTVAWSDDDYQNFTSGVSLNLYQELPVIRRLGRTRRRAFKFTFTANAPMRFFGAEVDVNMGQH